MKIYNCYLSTAIVAAASLTVITSSSIKLVQVQAVSIHGSIVLTAVLVLVEYQHDMSVSYTLICSTLVDQKVFYFHSSYFLHNLQLYSRNRFLIK